MERTKVNSVVNDTAKAPKNQGLSEKWFQSGHSFSSAPRYDRFDTTPDIPTATYALPYSIASALFFQESETIFSRKVANLSGKG